MSTVTKFQSPKDLINYVLENEQVSSIIFKVDSLSITESLDNKTRPQIQKIFSSVVTHIGRSQTDNETFTFQVVVFEGDKETGAGIWSIFKKPSSNGSNKVSD